jgi:2-C-methyl-D-erythritol 2,4-cyclodiphosphate synthase
MRIGFGYDAHRFIDGDYVTIGGVKIPYKKGIQAHSDGDVLLHAIGDALLGAAALGDLGQHFPDTDPRFKSVASSSLIEHIMSLLQEKNYTVVNIDATVITEAPRLSKYIDPMRQTIAQLLHIPIDDVNVKATTNEKMGWIGRGEGLAAQAVVLIYAHGTEART